MFQMENLTTIHTKAIESAHAFAELALDSAKSVSDIHQDAVKDAMQAIHNKVADLIQIKDLKQATELVKVEDAQAAFAEAITIQSKISKVFKKSNHEIVQMIDLAHDESKAQLRKMVQDSTKNAPQGSEPVINTFEFLLESSIKAYDQAYVASKEVFESVEKSIDNAFGSFQGHLASEKKTTAKKTKAIAA